MCPPKSLPNSDHKDGTTVVTVAVVQDNSTIGHKGPKETAPLLPATVEEEEATSSAPSPLLI